MKKKNEKTVYTLGDAVKDFKKEIRQLKLKGILLKKKDAPWITCKNCNYEWQPEPSKWRRQNLAKIKGANKKTLHCPICRTRNLISSGQYLYFLTWWLEFYNQKEESKPLEKFRKSVERVIANDEFQ